MTRLKNMSHGRFWGDITFEENAFTGKLIPIIEIEGVQTEDEET